MPPGKRKGQAQVAGVQLVLDSNLWVLLLTGVTDISLIRRFKRTSEFSVDDFNRLHRDVQRHEKIATTPNIVTEVSNLLGSLLPITRTIAYDHMKSILARCGEVYLESATLSAHAHVVEFGLTDVSVVTLAERGFRVFTADGRLADYLRRRNAKVDFFAPSRR